MTSSRDRPLRIVHAIDSLDASQGGPPQVVQNLAEAQLRAGHEVTVITRNPGASRGRGGEFGDSLPVRTIEGRATRRGLFGGRWSRMFGERPDFVHLHELWQPVIPALAAAAARDAIPHCICPHGVLDRWCLRQKGLKKRIALRLLYRRALERASFLHVLNRAEAEAIGDLRLSATLRVFPNGVDEARFETLPPPGTFARLRPDLGDGPMALFLARLHHKKGLDVLAESLPEICRRCPDLRVVVAGPDEGAGASFRAAVEAAGLGRRVFVPGPIYGEEKLAALRDATVFLLPSRQEGFSVALLEALAAETPVVITDACNFPEVADERVGRICTLDPAVFADAVCAQLEDPDGVGMGRRGRAMVLRDYVWSRIAAALVEAYRDAASTPAARSR